MAHRRIETQTIVLVGDLNPAIIHPSWEPLRNALREMWGVPGPEQATEVVSLHELSRFNAGSLRVQVEPLRFQATDDAPAGRRLADFMEQLFGRYLIHTPARAVGINYECLVQCESEQERKDIGYRLVPPAAWGAYSEAIGQRAGGMVTLTVQIPAEVEGFGNMYRHATVTRRTEDNTTFTVRVNNHFGLTGDAKKPAGELIPQACEHFDESLAESVRILEAILG